MTREIEEERSRSRFFDRVAWLYDCVCSLHAATSLRAFRLNMPLLSVPPGGSILDIGCGTGSLALHLAEDGFAVHGVDRSPAMISRANRKTAKAPGDVGKRLQFTLLDAVDGLPFGDGDFDLVVCAAVLHGLRADGRLALLREARRLSRGTVLVQDYPPFPGPKGIGAPFIRLVEKKFERSDFECFVRQGGQEMRRVFESVTVVPMTNGHSWYLCGSAV